MMKNTVKLTVFLKMYMYAIITIHFKFFNLVLFNGFLLDEARLKLPFCPLSLCLSSSQYHLLLRPHCCCYFIHM